MGGEKDQTDVSDCSFHQVKLAFFINYFGIGKLQKLEPFKILVEHLIGEC